MLTILTEPVTIAYNIRNVLYPIIGKGGEYGGHPARTERMIEGLKAIGYNDFNYRPKSINEIGNHIHVLANYRALAFAIKLKKEGRIEKLTAGPNIVVFPDEYDSIIADPSIDLYLQPSQWSADLHIQLEPRLAGRCVAYPYGGVGIDTKKIFPTNQNRAGNVLVYIKTDDQQLPYHIIYTVKEFGYNVKCIKYGHYSFAEYLELLDNSEFMITVGRSESCGHYLTESWAMDVPTVCYDPHYYHWTIPRELDCSGNISTCPNLTDDTGVRFSEIRELKEIISNMSYYKSKWHPRQWVVTNMSLENCSRLFLKTIGIDF